VVNNAASTSLLDNPLSQGMILVSPNADYVDNSIPAVKQFSDALNAYNKGILTNADLTYNSMAAWAGGMLFYDAAKAGKLGPSATSQDVKNALYSLKNETLGGLAPPLNFSPGKDAFPACYFLTEVENKTLVSLNGGHQYCVSPTQLAALEKVPNG
jgi:branched-chain amino acid transport system substrate-binding protein